jgi:hypothetical protein
MLWIWALSWPRIKTLAPVSKCSPIFFGPSNVSMVTVHNSLENIWGWCICGFFRNPFWISSSWTGRNHLFSIVKDVWYFFRIF